MRKVAAVVGIAIVGAVAACGMAMRSDAAADGKTEVAAFNEKFRAAHERMDTPGILGMWAETGVSLLPDTAPVVGKPAIVKFMNGAMANLTGYKELKVEMDFHDVRVCGEWATEWAIEHQVIQPPDGKPVIDHWGKFALILHKDSDGVWRVQQEMWNSTPKPE
ncbi:MAG TPA: SgcJ/EcaC family oxidoreductase [Candidatus Acidoferrum sp.]|nr:SgcJ/EcaC family oxidoreductase [Candidatus Acidoferrum sp.]